jgi:predicted enzyme related to lactoylglutathione lyase
MELVQVRIVTDDVERLAAFYASLAGVAVALNEYYVEVPAGPMSVGFSRQRFTEHRESQDRASKAEHPERQDEIILDFRARDVDAEYGRVDALGVDWVMPLTTQPCITVAVFRRVAALLLSVMSWVAEGVTFGHLLPAGAGYPVPAGSRVL